MTVKRDANVVEVDGSMLEGGGQLIRTSISLSAILRKSVKIPRIRHNRAKPGLAAQHCTGVRLVSEMIGNKPVGCEILSSSLLFPSTYSNKKIADSVSFLSDAGTAGAITLMIQVSLPVALFFREEKDVSIKYKGGTNVSHSPPTDHMQLVLLPLLRTMGVIVPCLEIQKRGFYPVGGGEVNMTIQPLKDGTTMKPLNLVTRGIITKVQAVIFGNFDLEYRCQLKIALSSALSSRITSEQLIGVAPDVHIELICSQSTSDKSSDCSSSGSSSGGRSGGGNSNKRQKKSIHVSSIGVQLCAYSDSGCILSVNRLDTVRKNKDRKEGRSPEDFAESLTSEMFALIASGCCIDEHTADQVILYMALATGRSQLLVAPTGMHSSLHLETVMEVVTLMLGGGFNSSNDETRDSGSKGSTSSDSEKNSSSCSTEAQFSVPRFNVVESLTQPGCRLVTCDGIGLLAATTTSLLKLKSI